jgi:glutathione S-transferase
MSAPLVLVSHALCPYVQRAAIVLAEKGVGFERRDIDLADKPAWFLRVTPLGKTPVLLVDGAPVFESAVICEYLDETLTPRLHPVDPLRRAQHRGWMEFGSQVLNEIAGFYSAIDDLALQQKAAVLRTRFEQLERALGDGPWFGGTTFGLVDAVFGPVFRYFDVFDELGEAGLWSDLPLLQRWRAALSARPSVRNAVAADYPQRLRAFVRRKGGVLGLRSSTEDRTSKLTPSLPT